ncbi:MAG: hypothetical protein OXM56_13055 [Gammaproteobacteria bacterium]|nr:hypothetical protein [Gammaproteobacteria bacterium]
MLLNRVVLGGAITEVFVLGDGHPAVSSNEFDPLLVRGIEREMIIMHFD